MGRKGVSKHKPSKTKSGPVTIGSNSAGSIGSKMADLPVQVPEKGAAIPQKRGGIKPTSRR